MDAKQLTPYDQLPPAIAENPFVRDAYIKLKLIDDAAGAASAGPRRKMELDWKVLVIVGCFLCSGYIFYNMFFASSSSSAGTAQQTMAEIAKLEARIAAASGPEKATLEQMVQALKQTLPADAMNGPNGMMIPMPPIPPGPPGTPAH